MGPPFNEYVYSGTPPVALILICPSYTLEQLASTEVVVAVNNIVISPTEYTVDYGDSTHSGVTFNTAPANGSVIVILEAEPESGIELRIFQKLFLEAHDNE